MADAEAPEGIAQGEAAFDTGAAAIALSLDEARADPSLRGQAAAFLAAQRDLVEAQKEHLKGQAGDQRLRTASDGMKLALQALTLAAVLALVAVLGLMVREASRAEGLVVEGFSTPPSFAARGVTGDALAADIMSRIAEVDRTANANSLTHSEDVRAGGGEPVKLQIPETGVSLGEVDRFLRSHLGHETSLTGQLVDDGAGAVTINMQVAGRPPITVRGAATDIDGLKQLAAEKAFAAFDPGNYVIYLSSRGRDDEAFAAAEATVRAHSGAAGLYTIWAGFDGDRRRALQRVMISVEHNPENMIPWMEATGASEDLGHDEAMLAFARRLLRSRIEDQYGPQRSGFDQVMAIGRVRVDKATGDFGRLQADTRPVRPGVVGQFLSGALAASELHDPATAEHLMANAALSDQPPAADVTQAMGWREASRIGDWPAALEAAAALVKGREAARVAAPIGGVVANQLGYELSTRDRPMLALAQVMTGHAAEAQALIGTTPLDCYFCIRVRGAVAEGTKDAAGADRWFAAAVRQGPSLPFAHLEWGQAKLARGDAAGALAEFAKAQPLGPRFADPLEGWGEALLARGDAAGAAAKFQEASRLAPRWGRLRLKWGEALARSGKADEARSQWRLASGLSLSRVDRAELAAQRI